MSLPSETSLGLGRNALIPHRDVFAHFLKSMGLSDNIAIIQRTRIDDDEDILYDMPHPVYAVIVVVPQGTFERSPEVNHWFWFREPGPGEEIKRFEQTIDNARGLYAFFHAFANSPLQQCCDTGSTLDFFLTRSHEDQQYFLQSNERLRESYAEAIRLGRDEFNRIIPYSGPESRYLCFFKKTVDDTKLWLWDSDPDRILLAEGLDETTIGEPGCCKFESLQCIRQIVHGDAVRVAGGPEMILCLADEYGEIEELKANRDKDIRMKGVIVDDEAGLPRERRRPQKKRQGDRLESGRERT